MKKNILIGTNHKTGTVWIGAVFRLFCEMSGIKFYNISRKFMNNEEKLALLKKVYDSEEFAVFFDHHSEFPLIPSKMKHAFKGIHMVRKPSDVLISCALYHAWSDESWLHIAREKFDGKTYCETINSLPNIKDKLEFEMQNSAQNIIKKMASFDKQDVFLNISFEILMKDRDLFKVIEICRYLELEGEEIINLQKAFYKRSLFGEKDKNMTAHIQPDTEKNEYKEVFKTEISSLFNTKFEDEIKKLGY